MRPKTERKALRGQTSNQDNSEGLNWVLIVGGAVLTTLSIKIGCKLKQAFTAKRPVDTSNDLKGSEFVWLKILWSYFDRHKLEIYISFFQEISTLVVREGLEVTVHILVCIVLSRVKMDPVAVSLVLSKTLLSTNYQKHRF